MFTETKKDATELAVALPDNASALHGDIAQAQREVRSSQNRLGALVQDVVVQKGGLDCCVDREAERNDTEVGVNSEGRGNALRGDTGRHKST